MRAISMNKLYHYRALRLPQSYWPADRSRALLEWTLGDALRDAAAAVPDRAALVEGIPDPRHRRRWTFSQLLADAEQLAAALLDRFEPGEHVAVWAANIPEWELLLYGCALAGIVLVTVNPAYKARELHYVLANSGAAGLFAMDDYRGHDTFATATAVRPELPALRELISFSRFDEFSRSGSMRNRLPATAPLDPCIIMFTSGTTGAQKGVVMHHKGIINVTNFTQERGGLALGGVFVNPMPMFHIGALGHAAVGALMRRATHVLAPGWDPVAFMELVASERGTYSLLVPTMIESVLASDQRRNYDLTTLRHLVSGAAMVEASLITQTKAELGTSLCNIYGQTEMQGVICGVSPDDATEDQAATIGQPMPQVEVKIGDPESGEVLPIGSQGEIYVRGYQTMIGYFNMPEATAKTLEADGWLHSGDLGSMDERGFLKITGRIRELIKRGGESVYPREIENLLMEHPKVAGAAVIGIPDRHWGEHVGAIIIARSSADCPSPAELHAFCRTHLASYKTPRFWGFVTAFPATETGKLQKFKLLEAVARGELVLQAT
jgi:fatty-acyl-CoA synthase